VTATALAPHAVRRVEHAIGMPVSLALRGQYARGAAADEAWTAPLTLLRKADRLFRTYRVGSVVSRLNRRELDVADAPREVHEMLDSRPAPRRLGRRVGMVHRTRLKRRRQATGARARHRAPCATCRHRLLPLAGDLVADGSPSRSSRATGTDTGGVQADLRHSTHGPLRRAAAAGRHRPTRTSQLPWQSRS
jgi:hypothetical protein